MYGLVLLEQLGLRSFRRMSFTIGNKLPLDNGNKGTQCGAKIIRADSQRVCKYADTYLYGNLTCLRYSWVS